MSIIGISIKRVIFFFFLVNYVVCQHFHEIKLILPNVKYQLKGLYQNKEIQNNICYLYVIYYDEYNNAILFVKDSFKRCSNFMINVEFRS